MVNIIKKQKTVLNIRMKGLFRSHGRGWTSSEVLRCVHSFVSLLDVAALCQGDLHLCDSSPPLAQAAGRKVDSREIQHLKQLFLISISTNK